MKTTNIFVLRNSAEIPDFFQTPTSMQEYDYQSHLWRWKDTGKPVVINIRNSTKSSEFGETEETATVEGSDQPEVTDALVSSYGETLITKTVEGEDQSEITCSSDFGETSITDTVEGVDTPEVSSLDVFAYYKCC